MILRLSKPAEAHDEKELRTWLRNVLGDEDERVLTDWMWRNHLRNEVHYLAALGHVVRETHARGKQFVGAILDFVRSIDPSDVEAVALLLGFTSQEAKKAEVTILGHRADPAVLHEELVNLRAKVRAELHRLWPDRHRASIDGALLTGLTYDAGRVRIDAIGIVQALRQPDPLAMNAKASWL